MEVNATQGRSARETLLTSTTIAGVVLEVGDLTSTRAFYGQLFHGVAGEWEEAHNTLSFTHPRQRIYFIQQAGPQTLGETGRHQAFRVEANRLRELIDRFCSDGLKLDFWREDYPPERLETVYLHDPSGNRVQLIPASAVEGFLDHTAVEVHDLEPATVFYTKVLGGAVAYYHGRAMNDFVQAKAWGNGADPCAPWTRLFVEKRVAESGQRRKVPRPNQQVFLRFGENVLGLILAREHRREPPEGVWKGTPRVIFRASQKVADATERLSTPDVSLEPEGRINLSFEREGQNIFLRDPGGNFVQVECAL